MLDTVTSDTLPPGPAQAPDEQLQEFLADPFGHVERMARAYGPIFTLRLGALGNEGLVDVANNGAWVFLGKPHQIRAMYSADQGTVSGALANAVFFGTNEKSVSYLDGRAHRQRRAQIQPSFVGARDYSAIIVSTVERHLAVWPRRTPVPLFPLLQTLTADIIVEVVCGLLDPTDKQRLVELLPQTETAANGLAEILRADAAIRALVAARMGDHLARAARLGRDDVLAGLLRTAEDDASLTPEVVRDEVFSLLYTGFSTTANTLSWAVVRILDEPQVQRRIAEELGDRFADQRLGREAFGGLPYLEAAITETLRLHPVSALNGVRMVLRPMSIDGYTIPAGTILVHCAHLIQRDAEFYAAPECFDPGRFLDGVTDPYAWAAFGGGNRQCLGRGYSREEMKMILALLLARLRLRRDAGVPPARQQGIFMAPADLAACVID